MLGDQRYSWVLVQSRNGYQLIGLNMQSDPLAATTPLLVELERAQGTERPTFD